jgi:hypothetical protein
MQAPIEGKENAELYKHLPLAQTCLSAHVLDNRNPSGDSIPSMMRADASRGSQIDLRRTGDKWLLEVDHKPVMITRDGRWLRRFTARMRRVLSAGWRK